MKLFLLVVAAAVSTVMADKYQVRDARGDKNGKKNSTRMLKSKNKDCVEFYYNAKVDTSLLSFVGTQGSVTSGVVRGQSDPSTQTDSPWTVTGGGLTCTTTGRYEIDCSDDEHKDGNYCVDPPIDGSESFASTFVCTFAIEYDEGEGPTLTTSTCSTTTYESILYQVGSCAFTGGTGIFQGTTGLSTFISYPDPETGLFSGTVILNSVNRICGAKD